MHSLRKRAIVGGTIWAIAILLFGGLILLSFFTGASYDRFDRELTEAHAQLDFALEKSSGNTGLINVYLNNPDYNRDFSGRYWEIRNQQGETFRSRSMIVANFSFIETHSQEIEFWENSGSLGQIRGTKQELTLEDGTVWKVAVAHSLDGLNSELAQIRQNLFSIFGLIGALGVAASVLLASLIVRPITNLRRDVSHRWEEGTSITATDYPEEVAPLVMDINTLLKRNRELVDRARRQAADMAHALKTPCAILRNELDALGFEGAKVQQSREALDRIDAQLLRALARIRAANTGEGLAEKVNLKSSVDRLARLFRRVNESEGRELSLHVDADITLPMDIQDLEEVLGNTMENAFKHCDCLVHVAATKQDNNAIITIEDDGPGIAKADRDEAMRSGGRLDTNTPGTGLGLAIAIDLVGAYGGTLTLEDSDFLGGLRVACTIPMTPFGSQIHQIAAE